MRWLLASAALLPLVVVAACDIGDLTGGDAGSSTDGEAPPPNARPCSGGGYCRVAAPSGWLGPGVINGACAEPFGARTLSLNEGLDGGAHTCACGCTSPNTKCDYVVERFSGDRCDGTSQGVGRVWSISDCWTSTSSVRVLDASVTSLGSCAPFVDAGKDTPSWSRAAQFCAGSFYARDCAAGELCVTSPVARVCIAREGEHACPGSPYTARSIHYQGHDDTRGCGPCSCGKPVGCAPVRLGRQNPCPSGAPSPIYPDDAGCVGPFEYVSAMTTGSCPPSAPVKVGDVRPAQPVTVCCEP